MKIFIDSDSGKKELEITIRCNGLTPELERVIATLRMMERQLTGIKNGETHLIDAARVLYIDTVERKTFLYTSGDVYETSLPLYQLEDELSDSNFFRINKSCIINWNHVASLKTEIDRRIRATMDNGEQLVVSRQYAEKVKERLGVK